MDADLTQMHDLAHDIGQIPGRVVPQVRAVVKRAAQNVKDDTRRSVSTHPSWKRLAGSVNYDMHGLSAVIGYDKGGQGSLGHIAEFGTATKAPHPALMPAARKELPNFAREMGKIKDGLDGRGR